MNHQSILSEVQAWPSEERLHLIEELWDSLSQEDDVPELSPELKDLLDRRVAELEANPDAVVSWSAIEALVLKESLARASCYNPDQQP